MPVAAVVAARDVRELAQLRRAEQPVGNGHAQHRRIALDIQAILQAQGPELVLGEFAREETPRLVAELGDPLVDDALIIGVVTVHARIVPIRHIPEKYL